MSRYRINPKWAVQLRSACFNTETSSRTERCLLRLVRSSMSARQGGGGRGGVGGGWGGVGGVGRWGEVEESYDMSCSKSCHV